MPHRLGCRFCLWNQRVLHLDSAFLPGASQKTGDEARGKGHTCTVEMKVVQARCALTDAAPKAEGCANWFALVLAGWAPAAAAAADSGPRFTTMVLARFPTSTCVTIRLN